MKFIPVCLNSRKVAPGGGTVAADGPGGAELCSGLQQLPEQCEEGAHQHWSIPQGFSTAGRVCKADLPHHSCSSERRERKISSAEPFAWILMNSEPLDELSC